MITGSVSPDGSEATVSLEVTGTGGRSHTIEAVLDTGFNGYLTLPAEEVVSLGLPQRGFERYFLADGSERLGPLYRAVVLWHGRNLTFSVGEGDPLVGMALLSGSRLTVDAEPGGEVRIDQLP
ncbi:MAG: hypothetical protein WA982_03770 [Rubrobacteraceae bacterium]